MRPHHSCSAWFRQHRLYCRCTGWTYRKRGALLSEWRTDASGSLPGGHRVGSAWLSGVQDNAERLEPGVAYEVADAEGAGECCRDAQLGPSARAAGSRGAPAHGILSREAPGRAGAVLPWDVLILGAPYSEHSSFSELSSCVRELRPKVLVPTVSRVAAGAWGPLLAR